MSNFNSEVVIEGWLTKSPPPKGFWKARWRRRWFVLRHSGELPGQFVLMYYTDKNCRKLKGIIDLDQCDQVDAGLRFENSQQNYPHMFDVRTPKRTYYLAAESETDMNKWVDCVCQVCGLKATIDDTSVEFIEEGTESIISSEIPENETPPVSPLSTVSGTGPYIPISECHSGKSINTPKGMREFNNIVSRQSAVNAQQINITNQSSHAQINKINKMVNNNNNNNQNNSNNNNNQHISKQHTICSDDISKSDENKPIALPIPPNSLTINQQTNSKKITNIESAAAAAAAAAAAKKLTETATTDDFYDSPRRIVIDNNGGNRDRTSSINTQPTLPEPNWETFPATGADELIAFAPGEIGSWSVVQRFGKLTVVDSKVPVISTLNRHKNSSRTRIPYDTYSLGRPVAPPRPPKPPHLVLNELQKKEEQVQQQQQFEDTYDIPRSHQPNQEVDDADEADVSPAPRSSYNYTNAVATLVSENVFRYDFTDDTTGSIHSNNNGEPISPFSTQSNGSNNGQPTSMQYSNLPSPHLINAASFQAGVSTPPAVNRGLKPRKISDTTVTSIGGGSSDPSPSPSPSPFLPPSIDRTLKPKKLSHPATPSTADSSSSAMLKLARPPDAASMMSRRRRRGGRAGPTDDPNTGSGMDLFYHHPPLPTPIGTSTIQYLDLDLDGAPPAADNSSAHAATTPTAGSSSSSSTATGSTTGGNSTATNSNSNNTTSTVYNTVDFLKTEAFHRTRLKVEEERSKCAE